MATDHRLFGPKQIALIAISGIVGIGFFLVRRYYETGTLGPTELIASILTVALFVSIAVLVVRRGNSEE